MGAASSEHQSAVLSSLHNFNQNGGWEILGEGADCKHKVLDFWQVQVGICSFTAFHTLLEG